MKRLLVVVDYQNDFVDGALGFEKAKMLEQNIINKIKEYKHSGDAVAFTLDTHEECYLDTREGRALPIAHCIKDTEGWQLYGGVRELCDADTPVFVKHSFGSDGLYEYLKNSGDGYHCIELAGVVTNICVISNAVLVQTALPEAEVVVDSSCCASNDDSLHKMALDIMKNLHITIV